MDTAKVTVIPSGGSLRVSLFTYGHIILPSILLGVSLSKLENDYEGNLSVWPGSHFLLHR